MNERTVETDREPGVHSRLEPDAQGQAALLLTESLIHSLLDNGALTKDQAIEAIDSVLQVKEESTSEGQEPAATMRRSLSLLENISRSIAARPEPSDRR